MEEENRSFSWAGLFIKIILVVVFILFTIWLLSLTNKDVSNSLDVLKDEIFAENLEKMKKVGKEYFTKDNLPSKLGEIEKLTLKEMYEKKLLIEIKDKNGDFCSEDNSYVSVEKFEDEYQMKVNLECGEAKDYVIVTITCTEAGTCVSVDNSETEYEYKKVSGGSWGKWSNWSEWSKVAISKLDNRDVETKIEKETNTYTEEETTIDYKEFDKVCKEGYSLTADKTSCYKVEENHTNPICDRTSNFVSQNGFNCKYIEKETNILVCPNGYELFGNVCKKTVSDLKLLDTVKPVCPQKEGYNTTDRNGFACTYTKYTAGKFITTETGESIPANNEKYVYIEAGKPEYKLNLETNKMGWVHIYGKYESVVETETGNAVCNKEGYVQSGDVCNKYELHTDTPDEELVCEVKPGYALTQSGTTCIYKKETIKEATCPTGYKAENNSCVKVTTTFEDYIKSCPVEYTLNGNKCEKEVISTVTKTDTIEVTYYRYRLREYKNGTTSYKWSSSKNDKNLLNAGYKLTGKTR